MTPDMYTLNEEFIKTSDGHQLYTQVWGSNNPDAPVFIFLHGGPGSGCSDNAKKSFDPNIHKVIFFDQRGSGFSTPKGSLKNNTTKHLIEDINLVADYYDIIKFHLVGRSWGSTLALAYAIENGDRVDNIITGGIFTGSQEEIDFLDKGKFKDFFPEAWEDFLNSVPDQYRDNPAKFHSQRALGNNKDDAKQSAYEYNKMEYAVLSLDDRKDIPEIDDFEPESSIIEINYTSNLCFMPDNYVMDNAHKIKSNVWIIQGRYDAICAPVNAYRLHSQLQNSTLIWTTAGHSGSDRANYDATKSILSTITDKIV